MVDRLTAPGGGAGVPASRTVTGGSLATGGGDLSANRVITVTAATQADQEAASSNAVAVTPAVQESHPSAAKCWGYVTVSGGAPTLAASYNITSITDVGVGELSFTIGTDFSSVNWMAQATVDATNNLTTNTIEVFARAAGSVQFKDLNQGTGVIDPLAYNFAGFGDQ